MLSIDSVSRQRQLCWLLIEAVNSEQVNSKLHDTNIGVQSFLFDIFWTKPST